MDIPYKYQRNKDKQISQRRTDNALAKRKKGKVEKNNIQNTTQNKLNIK
jgi:hypothetical protein